MSNKLKQNISRPFQYDKQSQAYADWANMQQNELNERAGDGYSPWEYMADTVTGVPDIVRKQITDWYQDGGTSSPKMNEMLDQMRAIADQQKKNPAYQLSPTERGTSSAWELLRTKGQVP